MLVLLFLFIDLAACMETLKNTHAHLDFDYYEFAKGIGAASGAFNFEFLSHQHYFMIYKDNNEGSRLYGGSKLLIVVNSFQTSGFRRMLS